MEPPPSHLLAVVVPVRDEAPNIPPLVAEFGTALAGIDHEIIFVDDGSTDDSQAVLAALAKERPEIRVLRHTGSFGQSAAILTGVTAANAVWIATIDGDGQNDPADIPDMLQRAWQEERPDEPVLVAGRRVRRKDSAMKRIASRIANGVRARVLHDGVPDSGCGLKLFRRSVFLGLPRFDHMHRFLPALFASIGGRTVLHPVAHRPRVAGRSHYGTWDRLRVGIVDLAGVAWLQRRACRPVLGASAADAGSPASLEVAR
ncbi:MULTISPECIES: glycosyltransferase family 2 protein [Acidiphilium]|jgi:dolichol-phosphate mannosyltransferase|uniref:Putative glycosyltransferase n=1 Tax=Acidiphilium multivorum (strain DSM 11245 / JCM 8867 / NBRC 100883 / AIU 301) TaxID=926570 RepID=F0J5K9_ACIMA|nr:MULTISPECIES: glycosyltransferase family 2 protein [Acidiphilium]MBU6355595.1 glycosyltransferase family 2 protein [Rhodospirillales bacterium]EGO93528.1 Glycosyl transferase family protein [Acidiphilium sp. PM]KDM65739.1 undecaprenyl-phosphate 4-deoxy-4-formamido-L-arabinose transferase ArnC [Acidiphilium sp. JA12-A1]MBS3022255.1 glycosyltransferase family 2 protein [Acidiphilium multivorum]MDE2329023.1 glycosyltransferase family 2 protein [Rhodospirillales bacterium]